MSSGSAHTFAWLEEELYALDEVVSFASKRLSGAADVLEQEFYRRVSPRCTSTGVVVVIVVQVLIRLS